MEVLTVIGCARLGNRRLEDSKVAQPGSPARCAEHAAMQIDGNCLALSEM